MARSRSRHSEDPTALLNAIEEGDQGALAKLLAWSCDDLRQYVQNRLDRRLAARFDAADVLQEVQISVTQRIDDYLRRRPMPYRLWLRQTALERLTDLRRHHLRQRRSPQAEEALPDKTSLALIRSLVDPHSSPSRALAAAELARAIKQALSELPEADREIVLMRQLENTPFPEIATILEIEPAAARKRFGRALGKLEEVLRRRGLLE
jgi:RNA polymerase sigma-70 factor (ECF subfamily)